MEKIIELIKNKYSQPIALTIHSNGLVSLSEEFEPFMGDAFVEFDSLEELRTHLNE